MLEAHLAELDRGREIVCYLQRAPQRQGGGVLHDHGFAVRSLAGGIQLWANELEPAMSRY